MLDKQKHDLIMQHYQHPQNQGLVDDKDYLLYSQTNALCLDQVTLQVKIKKNCIVDIKCDVHACHICLAATSLMSMHLKNKSCTEVLKLQKEFFAMINQDRNYNKDYLPLDLQVFDIVHQLPKKIKCVLLPWQILKNALKKGSNFERSVRKI